MKNLFILLLIFSPLVGKTQNNWNLVIDSISYNKSNVTDNVLFQDSLIVVSGHVNKLVCGDHVLCMYNFHGQEIWSKAGSFDRLYTDSNAIYSAGYLSGGDVGGMEQIVLSKYDLAGFQLSQLSYPETPHSTYVSRPVSIDVFGNDNILVSTTNSIVKANFSNNSISETFLIMQEEIKAAFYINSNAYLIHTEHNLYVTDSLFAFHDSVNFSESSHKTLIINDTIYNLFSDKLIRFDFNLNAIDTLISDNSIEYKHMKKMGGNIWVSTFSSSKIKLHKLQNNNIVEVLSFDYVLNNQDYLISDTNFAFIGNSYSGQLALYGCQRMEHDSILTFPDIEITNFTIDNTEYSYSSWPGITEPNGYYFEAQITIKNNGIDTIKSFVAYTNLYGFSHCTKVDYYEKFTNLNLPPNDSVTVRSSRIYQYGVHNTNLCFEVLAPSSKIETNITDNRFCKTISITGIDEHEKFEVLKLYPNPVKDHLFLEVIGEGKKDILLTNIKGVSVYENHFFNSNFDINLSEINSGIYVLKIITDKDIIVRKVVKN